MVQTTLKLLHSSTSKAWLAQALAHLDTVLIDHAHCERKAAGVAMGFITRYPACPDLVDSLVAIAQEELGHFAQVTQWLRRRGVALRPLSASPYGAGLKALVCPAEPQRQLDAMLVAALIEARSHERLGLLAQHCPDTDLGRFYRSLMEAEARHYGVYWRLAKRYYSAAKVDTRLDELARQEAALLTSLHPEPRMHS